MPTTPRFKYFLSPFTDPLQKDNKIWGAPFPHSRSVSGEQSHPAAGISIRYEDYFFAARAFLEKGEFAMLTKAAAQRIKQEVAPADIREIRIFLEKHGEFYHPARVEMEIQAAVLSFGLNVAISQAGKAGIQKEYGLLKRLNKDFFDSFLPEVYGIGEGFAKKKNLQIPMFLGQWFEGFNEFHISRDPADGKSKVLVWDPVQGPFFFSAAQTRRMYFQAAMILTYYYDAQTFEQVFPWHHAAGDFVVKTCNNRVDVRLVTVRQYASLLGRPERPEHGSRLKHKEADAESILEALLIFFLNLSIRMRLDRIDGVGPVVWADVNAVKGTVDGFFKGLSLKPAIRGISAPVGVSFGNYFKSFSETEILDISRTIVNSYHPLSPDIPVINAHLKQHTKTLCRAMNQWLDGKGSFFIDKESD